MGKNNQKQTIFCFNGTVIESSDFGPKDEISELRKSDMHKPLNRRIKEKYSSPKEKNGPVIKYTIDELRFINCKKEISQESYTFRIIDFLYKNNYFIDYLYLKKETGISKPWVNSMLSRMYNILNSYGDYMERRKIRSSYDNKIKTEYKLTDNGKRLTPFVLTKMFNEKINEIKKKQPHYNKPKNQKPLASEEKVIKNNFSCENEEHPNSLGKIIETLKTMGFKVSVKINIETK